MALLPGACRRMQRILTEQITYITSQEAGGDSEMGLSIALRALWAPSLEGVTTTPHAILEGHPLTHGNLGKLTQLVSFYFWPPNIHVCLTMQDTFLSFFWSLKSSLLFQYCSNIQTHTALHVHSGVSLCKYRSHRLLRSSDGGTDTDRYFYHRKEGQH